MINSFIRFSERPKVRLPPEDKNITEEKHSRNLNIASSAREKGNEIKGKFMIISIPNKIHGAKKAAKIREMERKTTYFTTTRASLWRKTQFFIWSNDKSALLPRVYSASHTLHQLPTENVELFVQIMQKVLVFFLLAVEQILGLFCRNLGNCRRWAMPLRSGSGCRRWGGV